jgi:hypothetical protein
MCKTVLKPCRGYAFLKLPELRSSASTVNIPVNIVGWNTPNCCITFEMLPYCDVLPLRIMLWAIPHQLEGLSSVGSYVMSSNLNLIMQSSIFYYSKKSRKNLIYTLFYNT